VDEAAQQVMIPVLSIQPLVENAIKHGIARRTVQGRLRVRAECRSGELRVTVENSNGSGTPAVTGAGVGLQNVRRRLEICYGDAAELRFSPGPADTTVEFSIPGAPAASTPAP
jgi:LytS/YehU family sensor histidine kinase